MNEAFASRKLDDLEGALGRLEEALSFSEAEPLAIDATIRRFNLTFDPCWTTLKAIVESRASPAKVDSARAAINAAASAGWIDDETAWLDLLDIRSAASHAYREARAKQVYARIEQRTPMIRASIARLRAQLP